MISTKEFHSNLPNLIHDPVEIPFKRSISRLYHTSSSIHNKPNDSQYYSFTTILESLTSLFPLWVLSASLVGWINPMIFASFSSAITPALALVMFCMGMTLTFDDFKAVLNNWRWILVGFTAQYSIMPILAYVLAKYVYKLPFDLAIGLVLVGCSPGGTASNLVTLIAKADVALSVLMTTVSTLAAIIMTPLLITMSVNNLGSNSLFQATQAAGKIIKMKDLIFSVMNVVLLPVTLGLLFNTKYPKVSSTIATKYAPSLSVIIVSLICGTVTASASIGNRAIHISIQLMLKLLGAIVSLHSFGFLFGYMFANIFGANESCARTISIETGMQNSALASVLAQHFPNPSLSALPGAFSATCHSLIGSMLAAIWMRTKPLSTGDPRSTTA